MLDFFTEQNQSASIHYWLNFQPPEHRTDWPITDPETNSNLTSAQHQNLLKHTTRYSDWQWPDKKVHFLSDLHADADALIHSLLLTGIIKKTGLKSTDFIITDKGRKERIIIGGDCLDKGPSNLNLLKTLHKLKSLNKNTVILAGNHDIRLYMGLKALFERNNKSSEHFFIRMGAKVLPLFKEIYDLYLRNTDAESKMPSLDYCRRTMFPSQQWQQHFISASEAKLSSQAVERELRKIDKKQKHFETDCLSFGMTLPMIFIAARKCYELFMRADGDFFWFFDAMKLIHREKSFLFTHAGIDNKITKTLKKSGIKKINQLYRKQLSQDPCQFYYGTVANLLRTKYRKSDPKLGKKGVKRMHRLGIHAIVHGHVSQLQGQKIRLRAGMLHFECDVTLDRNSRLKSGLSGFGAGVTTISPNGTIQGISSDVEQVKVFRPRLN